MNPPFKTKGIYVKKIDPEKRIKNYKSTKLGKMWKAATGQKDGHFYQIIWFTENLSLEAEKSELKEYCAGFSTMSGEVLHLVDRHKNRGYGLADYQSVKYDERHFKFEDENISFSGSANRNFLFVMMKNKKNGESLSEQYRYIPWI